MSLLRTLAGIIIRLSRRLAHSWREWRFYFSILMGLDHTIFVLFICRRFDNTKQIGSVACEISTLENTADMLRFQWPRRRVWRIDLKQTWQCAATPQHISITTTFIQRRHFMRFWLAKCSRRYRIPTQWICACSIHVWAIRFSIDVSSHRRRRCSTHSRWSFRWQCSQRQFFKFYLLKNTN